MRYHSFKPHPLHQGPLAADSALLFDAMEALGIDGGTVASGRIGYDQRLQWFRRPMG